MKICYQSEGGSKRVNKPPSTPLCTFVVIEDTLFLKDSRLIGSEVIVYFY